jgi:AcrR family transcriptional regulator
VQHDSKSTQRQRLLNGMIDVIAREGYAATNVSAVIAAAGVSRPTFYEYFTDKNDGFLAALEEVNRRVLGDVASAVSDVAPEFAREAAIGALARLASAQPGLARIIFNEAMAGGPGALDGRDHAIHELSQIIERADRRLPATAQTPDVSTRMLLGAIYRLLAQRLRRGEPNTSEWLKLLIAWIKSYEQPVGLHRWSTLEPVALPQRSPLVHATQLAAPPPAPPGSSRRARRENQRERIMFATAKAAQANGYAATTIAEITGLADVPEHVFTAAFQSKQDAYMAAHEFAFLRTMGVTAGAFFTNGAWMARGWDAGLAFTQFLDANPTLAHVGFVDAYAVSPGAVKRAEELLEAFTMFFHEGYRFTGQRQAPSRVAVQAITATVFETAYHEARKGQQSGLAGLLPHLAFVCLAPFIGAQDANSFIEQKLRGPATPGR